MYNRFSSAAWTVSSAARKRAITSVVGSDCISYATRAGALPIELESPSGIKV
jgi:hypothetical protein